MSKFSKEDPRSLIKYSYKLNDSWILEKENLDKDILGANSSTPPEDLELRSSKEEEDIVVEEGGVKKEICLTSLEETSSTSLIINLTRRIFLAAHYNTADLTLLQD